MTGHLPAIRRLRIGKRQLETLVALGSPGCAMIVPDKCARSLVWRGLLKTGESGGFACITAAGLRVLAAEMEAGRVGDALERIRKDVELRRAKIESRKHQAGNP
jgi:hypothetical protein